MSTAKEVSKAWLEICLNTKFVWIKGNTSYVTLFVDHHKWHWMILGFFQAERLLSVSLYQFFLYEKQKKLCNYCRGLSNQWYWKTIGELIIQDFSLDAYLWPVSSANIAFGAVNAFKNLTLTLDATEIDNLRKTVNPCSQT